MILSILTGGIDLPKLAADLRVLQAQVFSARGTLPGYEDTVYATLDEIPTRFGSLVERLEDIDERIEETNAALADHIVKANARMTTIERVESDNTAQCQIRMNGLRDLIASRALAENVETLRMKLDRLEGSQDDCVNLKDHLALAVRLDALTKQVDALTAAKLSEVKARKAPKKEAAK
jgi:tetrahydromethanopterin S-methyltransferase subunit G